MPLRISYKGKKMSFLYKCKKRDIQEQIKSHMNHWSRGEEIVNGEKVQVEIPLSSLIAEWQDGEVWKEDSPAEVIPVPGA